MQELDAKGLALCQLCDALTLVSKANRFSRRNHVAKVSIPCQSACSWMTDKSGEAPPGLIGRSVL